MAGSGSGWSELPCDLLSVIEGHLGLYDDKIRFRCVCTHFRQSVSDDLPDLRQQQPLWLLLPYRTGSVCGLYHPLENKVFDIDLPEAGDKVFKGTGHGWVVTLQLNGSIDVLNPLTRVRVPLPPRYEFPDVLKYDPDDIGNEYLFDNGLPPPAPPSAVGLEEVRDSLGGLVKVVLSSSPLSDDFIAAALHPLGRLSYCKVGDNKWRDLDNDTPRRRYHDVTFFKGRLYALSDSPIGELMICDDFSSCPKLRKCNNISPFGEIGDDDCLANSSNYLLMAKRFRKFSRAIEYDSHMDGIGKIIATTTGFEILMPYYKRNVDQDTTKRYLHWGRPKRLGDDKILFMGLGTQVLVSSQDFIGKGNRIYFASDNLNSDCGGVEDCFDNGVFDFEDKSIKPLGYECSPRVIWPSPIWFAPNPY